MAYICKYLHTVIKQPSDHQVYAIQELTIKEPLPVFGGTDSALFLLIAMTTWTTACPLIQSPVWNQSYTPPL